MLEVQPLELAGAKLITPVRHADARGAFAEVWNRRDFAAAGVDCDWVQDNIVRSTRAGTVRGFHFQGPPSAQSKLIQVIAGRILDVIVDARRGSPDYGRALSVELSAAAGAQLFAPPGFLHAYMTLEDESTVQYKVDAYYDPATEGAVFWNDPDLGVDWGPLAAGAVVSERDARAQRFADFETPFVYEG
ncbi:MAG: dTDP-4-dehydrorhamnose 3,5-epimerase [Maricaulaceae bacterium]